VPGELSASHRVPTRRGSDKSLDPGRQYPLLPGSSGLVARRARVLGSLR